jgi:hypothetical protein
VPVTEKEVRSLIMVINIVFAWDELRTNLGQPGTNLGHSLHVLYSIWY